MYVSYFKGGLKKNGTPINCKNGSKLEIMEIDEVLRLQKSFSKDGIKHSWGNIYAFYSKVAYSIEEIKEKNITTAGACFLDIDNLTEEQSNTIYNGFKELCKKNNSLYACWKSYSGTGLHFVCETDEINAEEYERTELIQLMFLGYAIEKLFGIKLEEGINLDEHNKSIKQQLFLNPVDDVKFNLNCIKLDKSQDMTNIIEELSKIYPSLAKSLNKPKQTLTTFVPTDEKVNITFTDRNTSFHLDHTQRFALVCTLMNLLNNDKNQALTVYRKIIAHQTIGKHSMNEYLNEHNNIDETKQYYATKEWTNWLKNNFNIDIVNVTETKVENKIGDEKKHNLSTYGQGIRIEQGQYLSDEPYYTTIKEAIANNIVTCIVAPTGTGKTTMLNKIIKGTNNIILTPFRIMRDLYSESIKLVESVKDYDPNEPAVMTYDRFATINFSLLSGKTIYIDECHILFMDRTYRDRLVSVLNKLYELKGQIKIVLISATPLDEVNILCCEKIVQFWQPRTIMNLTWQNTNKPKNTIENIVNNFLAGLEGDSDYKHPYNRLIVFSDTAVRMIYDNKRIELMDECKTKFAMLHSDYKWTGDAEEIISTEILTKPVTLGTSLVFNGLNFKNKDEYNLVVIEMTLREDLAWKIIQAAGRLRKCNMDILVVASEKKKIADINNKIKLANAYQEIGVDAELFDYVKRLNNEDIKNALVEIEAYKQKYSTFENIKLELEQTGYIHIEKVLSTEMKIKNQATNKLRQEANDIIKQELIEYKLGDNLKKDIQSKDYYEKLYNYIKNFELDYDIKPEVIGYNLINEPTQKHVQARIDEMKKIIRSARYDEEDWTALVERFKESWKTQDQIIVKQQKTAIKKVEEYHEKYANDYVTACPLFKQIYPAKKGCSTKVILKYTVELKERNKKICERRTESGRNGGLKTQPVCVEVINTGEVMMFSNKTEAMKFIGCNSGTFSDLVKGKVSKKYSNYKVVDCKCKDK